MDSINVGTIGLRLQPTIDSQGTWSRARDYWLEPTKQFSIMSADTSRDRPSPNSYWVTRDRFAAGEYPGDWDSGEAATKIESLLRAGVDHFVDLTEARELEPYAGILEDVASRLGLRAGHERHPIVDGRIPDSPEQMVGILVPTINISRYVVCSSLCQE